MRTKLLLVIGSICSGACGGEPTPSGGSNTSGASSSTGGSTASSTVTVSATVTASSGVDGASSGPATSSTSAVATTVGVGSTGDETAGGRLDVGDTTGEIDECDLPPDLTLTGTVWAPNGELPVSGAQVYTSIAVPDGIPQEVYCDTCQELDCSSRSTTTAPDGTFELGAIAQDANYLVVQKGKFLRWTAIDFAPGDEVLADALTTLPAVNDPEAGAFIPLIAVGYGAYDRLEDALGKFGLGDTLIGNFEEQLVPGTEPFEFWDNGRNPETDGFESQGTFADLVSDPENLARYHIIFAPCSTDDYVSALIPQNVENIRNWVAAGGHWYVADWSNEWLINVFPEYQQLDCTGGDCDNASYDSLATVLDDDLLGWLEAIPEALADINPLNDESHPTLFELPLLQTVDSWSGIASTNPILVDDGLGGEVDLGHKVWLEGPGGQPAAVHPLTVTGQFGCGDLEFTSYHTAEFFDYVGLSPQELVLLYTVLEVGMCKGFVPTAE